MAYPEMIKPARLTSTMRALFLLRYGHAEGLFGGLLAAHNDLWRALDSFLG
jgi:hypothetical protein